MQISEFQELIRKIYFKRDRERGVEKTYMWLSEEAGELSEAIRLSDKGRIEEELADVLAWTVSLANLLGVSVEKAIAKKYPGRCAKCGRIPCGCP